MHTFKVKFVIIIIGPYFIFVRNVVFISQEQILYASSPLYMTLHFSIVAKSLIL
jgi:hypothetical protein